MSIHGIIDYFLPHMSSEFFRLKIYDQLLVNGTGIEHDNGLLTSAMLAMWVRHPFT
jgi:hypothetical protein